MLKDLENASKRTKEGQEAKGVSFVGSIYRFSLRRSLVMLHHTKKVQITLSSPSANRKSEWKTYLFVSQRIKDRQFHFNDN